MGIDCLQPMLNAEEHSEETFKQDQPTHFSSGTRSH